MTSSTMHSLQLVARLLLLGLVLVTAGCAAKPTPPAPPVREFDAAGRPISWLRNDHLAAMVYLPDAEIGHYRGSRFDWSGMIGRVVVDDQRFFGPQLPGKDNPRSHDYNAVGPCDEFGMTTPLGYDDAKPGETFIKIGVGHLTKPATGGAYLFHRDYPIAQPAAWTVETTPGALTFRQDVSDPRGWGYRYEKTVELSPTSPEMIIRHTLKNTGTRTIDTDQYCHNFARFGDDLTGADAFIELPFDATTANVENPRVTAASFNGRRLSILRGLKVTESVKGEFIATQGERLQYSATISNGKQAILIDSPQSPSALKYYGSTASLCIEPFLAIHLTPGNEMAWTVRYRFTTTPATPLIAERTGDAAAR